MARWSVVRRSVVLCAAAGVVGLGLGDAAAIRVPVLILRGDRDLIWSRAEDVVALRRELTNAPVVRAVTIPGGTHHVYLDRPERGRAQVLSEIVQFLAAPPTAAPSR